MVRPLPAKARGKISLRGHSSLKSGAILWRISRRGRGDVHGLWKSCPVQQDESDAGTTCGKGCVLAPHKDGLHQCPDGHQFASTVEVSADSGGGDSAAE